MFRLRPTFVSTMGTSAMAYAMRNSSNAPKDFYKTLGVPKTASKDEIKKAYRKRAMETHPDQGGKKEEFAEVSEAYECLSNAEKRQVYDQHGSEAVNNMGAGMGGHPGAGFGGRRPEDIFSEFFNQGGGGGFGGFGGFGGGGAGGRAQVQPIEVKLRMTLEEIAKGASKTVRVTRPTICTDCKGTGTKNQQAKPQCSQCHGSGQVIQQHRMGAGMVQQVISQCPRCSGSGTAAKKEDECLRCHGAGHRSMASDINLDVPPGIPSSATLVVQGEGGTIPNAQPGDLHVTIEQTPHPVFTRRGNDLTATFDITLSEALLGFEKHLKLVDGRSVCVKLAPEEGVVKQNSVIKLAGEGMPKDHGGKGDVFVFTNVIMPKTLNKEQKEAIEKAFGKPVKDANASSGNTVSARLLRETKEQLEQQKAASWSQEGSGSSSGRARGRGGRGGQQADCVQQ